MNELPGSDNDPKALAKKAMKERNNFPNQYMTCGAEDFLLLENRNFKEYHEIIGAHFNYVKTPVNYAAIFGIPKSKKLWTGLTKSMPQGKNDQHIKKGLSQVG